MTLPYLNNVLNDLLRVIRDGVGPHPRSMHRVPIGLRLETHEPYVSLGVLGNIHRILGRLAVGLLIHDAEVIHVIEDILHRGQGAKLIQVIYMIRLMMEHR